MNKLSIKIFGDYYADKYHIKFRDLYFILYDYFIDNKINIYICIDEYNDPFYGDFLENYDEKEPYISTLVVSLFCGLKAISKNPLQKLLPDLFLKNLVKILNCKYHHKSFCTIYQRIKNNFRDKLEDIQIKNKIALTVNMISTDQQDFISIQNIIHNLMNDLFNTNDFINDWTTIGFYSFYLCIENNQNKLYYINKYINYLVYFNTINVNNIYYSKGLYRNEFTF